MSSVDDWREEYAQRRETVREIDRDVSMAVTTLAAVESLFRVRTRGDETNGEGDESPEVEDVESVLSEWSYDVQLPSFDDHAIETLDDLQIRLQQTFDQKHAGWGGIGFPWRGGTSGPTFGGNFGTSNAADETFADLSTLLEHAIAGGGEAVDDLWEALEHLVDAYEDGDEPRYVGAVTTIASTFDETMTHAGELQAFVDEAPAVLQLESLEEVQTADGRAAVVSALGAGISDPDSRGGEFLTARETVSNAIGALETKAAAHREELTSLTGQFAEGYTNDLDEPIDGLEGSSPVVLLPTRLETRFFEVDDGLELYVRVYPDDVHVDTHERALTDDEVRWGRRFWELTLWASQDVPAAQLEESTDEERLEDVSFDALPEDPERRHGAVIERVWTQLVDRFGHQRAAWIKRELEPDGAATLLEGPQSPVDLPDVDFDALEESVDRRPSSWTRPPRARLLPDCWVAFAETSEGTETATSEPVKTPLSIGPDPGALETASETTEDVGLREGEIDWLFDFDTALEKGMALKIPLPAFDPGDEDVTVDRLVVLGVSSVEDERASSRSLSELLDAHHYTDGLSIVERETPTNDTREGSAGSEPSGTLSAFERECEPPVAAFDDGTDGGRAGRLLGIDPDFLGETGQFPLERVPGAGRTDDADAATMNAALWPATWGYYVPHMLAPHAWIGTAGPAKTNLLRWLEGYRRHFVSYVRGGGPLPTLRVGDQPYGVLPTTALESWESIQDYRVTLDESGAVAPTGDTDQWTENRDVETDLVTRLAAVRPWWDDAASTVATAATQTDSETFLATLLAMSGTGYGYRLRDLLSHSVLIEAIEQFDGIDVDDVPLELGDDPLLSEIVSSDQLPRIDALYGSDFAPTVTADLVDEDVADQLEGLRTKSFGWLRLGIPAGEGDGIAGMHLHPLIEAGDLSLLEALLYLGLLQEARLARFRLQVIHGDERPSETKRDERSQKSERKEKSASGVDDAAARHWSLFPEPSMYDAEEETLWAALAETVPSGVEKHLGGVSGDSYGTVLRSDPEIDPAFGALQEALTELESVDPAVLERLLRETLDLASHRFDAWATSVATRRLDGMRANDGSGVYVGAYGYVESLERRTETESNGYVHAPSIGQATTAAVLRSVHAARHDAYDDMLAIDLSSHRVRDARAAIDGVRAGHELGALLGYQFERGLHERSRDTDEELNEYVYPIRSLAPLVDGKLDREDDEYEESDDAAERDVVDGVSLLEQWSHGGEDDTIPWGETVGSEGISLPAVGTDEHGAIEAELEALEGTLDAVRDVLTAESVHQLVAGQPERAGASLDALSRGEAPSDLEVTKTPRTGTSCTHRLVALLDAEESSPWPSDSPRSTAEPALESWVASLLGDPSRVVCRAAYRSPDASETETDTDTNTDTDTSTADGGDSTTSADWRVVVIRLSEVDLSALDLLYLVEGDDEAWGSELEARIEYYLRRNHPSVTEDTTMRLSFAPPSEWKDPDALGVDPSATIGFGALLEATRSVRDLVTSARPVDARDLTLPGEAGGRGLNESVLDERATHAAETLETESARRLEKQLAAFTDPTREDEETSPIERGDPIAIADRLATLVDVVENLPRELLEDIEERRADLDREAVVDDLRELLAVKAGDSVLLERDADGLVVVRPDDPRVTGVCTLDDGESIDVTLLEPDGSTVTETSTTVDAAGRFEATLEKTAVGEFDGDTLVVQVRASGAFDTSFDGRIGETDTHSTIGPSLLGLLAVLESVETLLETLQPGLEAADGLDRSAIQSAAADLEASEWPAAGDDVDLQTVLDTTAVPLPGIEPPAEWHSGEAVAKIVTASDLDRDRLAEIADAVPADENDEGSSGLPLEDYESFGPAIAGTVFDSISVALLAIDTGIEAAHRRPDEAFVAGSLEALRSSLLVAADFGVHGSVPLSATGATSGTVDRLFAQADSVLEECETRLAVTDSTPADAAGFVARLEALFGESFQVLPPFEPPNRDELAKTLESTHSTALQNEDPLAAETWFTRVARVRDGASRFGDVLTYGEAIGERSPTDWPRFHVGQLPYEDEDVWVGLPEAWTENRPSGRLSIVAHTHGTEATETDELVGLFVDEFVETVPNESETTGVSVHYDAPTNRAPQTMLVAVPPTAENWSIETLRDVVTESVELAKLRTVDRDALEGIGHLLPALTLATNDRDPLPIPDTGSIPADRLAPMFWANATFGGAN